MGRFEEPAHCLSPLPLACVSPCHPHPLCLSARLTHPWIWRQQVLLKRRVYSTLFARYSFQEHSSLRMHRRGNLQHSIK